MAKILIIDDSKMMLMKLRQSLESGGHEVVEATDGLIGIERVLNHSDIQILLIDVNMPNMDGLAFVRELFEKKYLPGVPRLMLTTEAGREMQAEAKKFGVTAWLLKPVNREKLLLVVDTLLEKKN